LIDSSRAVLSGRSRDIHDKLNLQMQAAAEELEYEAAAKFRDRLRALSTILARQDINTLDFGDADIFALAQVGGESCLQVFFFRNGSNYGNRAYYPTHDDQVAPGEILASFIAQFYDERTPPPLLLLSDPVEEEAWLLEALSLKAGRKVSLQVPKRGSKADVVKHAVTNAKDALERRLAESATQRKLLEGVAQIFALSAPPQRIEVYDNSHIQGTNAIGAMIVAGPEGFQKNAYRTWTIKNEELTPGDDFGMMREVLSRRFARALKENPDRQGGSWPDLLVIDGGAGQLSAAVKVMEEAGVMDVPIVCFSACATKPTVLPSAPTGPNARRAKSSPNSMTCRASAPTAVKRCCIISARCGPSPGRASAISKKCRGSAKPSPKRFTIIFMAALSFEGGGTLLGRLECAR